MPVKRAFAGQRHRMALEHTVRGEFGGRHPLRKRPTRQTLVGNYAANCFCRRGAAPRCAGSGRMKLGKLGLPRPKAPNGAGIHPAWRLPTPGCELKTRYPVRKPPTRQTLAENFAAECPPPTWGGAPLRGVAVGDWRTRPAQTLGESPNTAPRGAELRIQGPPPSAKNTPRAKPGGEPRVKLFTAGVVGRPVAQGRAGV